MKEMLSHNYLKDTILKAVQAKKTTAEHDLLMVLSSV